MIINKQNRYKDAVVRKLLGLTYRLENVGVGDMRHSGEMSFIDGISTYYKGPIVFFDIGANLGDYTEALKKKRNNSSDQYHLFEPQKKCIETLKSKSQASNNVVLNNIGLSDKQGEATIYKDSEKSGLTSLYKRNLDYYKLKMDIEEKIILDTAENYIRKSGVKKINLVKIDVEGNEIKTLHGFGEYLNGDFIDFIQFEYGGANIDSHTNLLDFYNLLEPKGFTICKIMKKHLEHREYDPRLENFICQNYVAVSNTIFGSLVTK